MPSYSINISSGLNGTITIPGDKSISHRSVMFGSIAKGTTHICGFLPGADCISTINCFRQMGIDITYSRDKVTVCGQGLHGLKKPSSILDCGNSGTTTRLLSGILSSQDFVSTLSGDASIQKRPMGRIIKPLELMGSDIKSMYNNDCVPLKISGRKLKGIDYVSPGASAQVKSAILLAGLYAEGITSVTEPALSRNHTELMLKSFGADINSIGNTAVIKQTVELYANAINVPGDISSAAFFIAAGAIVPNSEIKINNVGINPTRDGILKVAKNMGVNMDIELLDKASVEPIANLIIRSSKLHGITIEGAIIPTLIDELPIIAAMACVAEGTTVIKDAQELKVKESNRIRVMVDELKKMGADITETDDGMIIHGGNKLHASTINSHKDHRIAMTFTILGLCIDDGHTEIIDSDCIDISYPSFYDDLKSLMY